MKSIISQQPQQQSLSNLAFDAGYFDQSYFNKDFKIFTGLTPTQFFKSPSFGKSLIFYNDRDLLVLNFA